ncbi:LytR C-terminal domain-containing protein [Brachybacterium sp. AOP43-C2-M15]|uniref:LytR C-terminal domain-containing protein n=1 Tax=Brachybacterium sp. AOP43-C2-M15 TaxID=3457661 RepID=UPI0040332215
MQLAIFSLLAVTLIAIGVYAVGQLRTPSTEPGVIDPKSFGPATAELACPEPDAVPLPPEDVTVTVLNGTTRSGLAGDVAEQLGERGYEIAETGNTRRATGPATIVHGPEGYLAAQSLRVQVEDSQLTLDEDVEGTAVDLLIGDGFGGLEDASAASSALEEPVETPEGC